jgi:hypothetical protein
MSAQPVPAPLCGACRRPVIDGGVCLGDGVLCASARNCVGPRDGKETERARQRELREKAQAARMAAEVEREQRIAREEAADQETAERDDAEHWPTCSHCRPLVGLLSRAQRRIGCQLAMEKREENACR